MIGPTADRGGRHAWAIPAGVFAAVLAGLWPTRVIVRGDDFGYLESVVAAIRAGVGTPSEWLEPLNFVLPALATGLWRMGGNFYVATLGLAAAIALLNFGLLWRWLRPQLPADRWSDATVLAVGLGPVVLNKTVEFTGVPLGWSFVLGALCAWRGRAAGWFFLLVALGTLNRQSAVVLLALPAVEQWRAWRKGARPEWRWAGGVLAVTALVGVVMVATPPTFARALAAQNQAFVHAGRCAAQFVLGPGLLGGIAAVWGWLRDESRPAGQGWLAQPGLTLAWLGAGAWVMVSGAAELRCETPWLERGASLVVLGAFVAAAAAPRALARVQPELLAAAGLYAALVAWRGVWWDYYLIEPALLLAGARPGTGPVGTSAVARWWCRAGLGVAMLWVYPLARQLRWADSRVVAYERALRTGQIDVTALSGAPFGFLGWKVFPALTARGVEEKMQLSDFLKFIEAERSYFAGGVIVPLPPAAERRSLHGSGERWVLAPDYRPRLFPLNEAEWRGWLEDGRR